MKPLGRDGAVGAGGAVHAGRAIPDACLRAGARTLPNPCVAARNRAVLSELPFADRQDFDDAMRGFVATVPDSRNPQQYEFLQADAPPSVNPSLWRLAQLNAINGLFTVVDGMYQVRGFSLANMTIVEGRTGIIVIDPLSTVASAKEGIDLYFAHRPRKPVVAVIYTPQPQRSLRRRQGRRQRCGCQRRRERVCSLRRASWRPPCRSR